MCPKWDVDVGMHAHAHTHPLGACARMYAEGRALPLAEAHGRSAAHHLATSVAISEAHVLKLGGLRSEA